MKYGKKYPILLLIACLLVGFLMACNEEEKIETTHPDLTGRWELSAIVTDNEQLNTALKLLFFTQGIDPGRITICFDADGKAEIDAPIPVEKPLSLRAVYAYVDRQLAFRFDDILPIPFNAFEVSSLTATELNMRRHLSPEVLLLLIKLIEGNNPSLASMLQTLLASSFETGLQLELRMKRSSSSN